MSSTFNTHSFFETYVVISEPGNPIPKLVTCHGKKEEQLAQDIAADLRRRGLSVEVTKAKPLRFRGALTS